MARAAKPNSDSTREDNAQQAESTAEIIDPSETDEHASAANDIIRRHSLYGLASGVIPVPLVDLTVSSTIQLRMISQLANLYGIPFSEQATKGTVASLVASALPLTGFGTTSVSLMRAVPLVGPFLGLATLPALFAAITYGLGKTFAWHFAKGGTLDNFNTKAFRDRFRKEVVQAKGESEPQAA